MTPAEPGQKSRRKLAQIGEQEAARYLRAQGYRILEQNYRCRLGEIDLVAQQGKDLVFIEVKARSSDQFGLPIEAITRSKQQRLAKIAACYLAEKVGGERPCRFDVVEVDITPQGKIEDIRLTRGAFMVDE